MPAPTAQFQPGLPAGSTLTKFNGNLCFKPVRSRVILDAYGPQFPTRVDEPGTGALASYYFGSVVYATRTSGNQVGVSAAVFNPETGERYMPDWYVTTFLSTTYVWNSAIGPDRMLGVIFGHDQNSQPVVQFIFMRLTPDGFGAWTNTYTGLLYQSGVKTFHSALLVWEGQYPGHQLSSGESFLMTNRDEIFVFNFDSASGYRQSVIDWNYVDSSGKRIDGLPNYGFLFGDGYLVMGWGRVDTVSGKGYGSRHRLYWWRTHGKASGGQWYEYQLSEDSVIQRQPQGDPVPWRQMDYRYDRSRFDYDILFFENGVQEYGHRIRYNPATDTFSEVPLATRHNVGDFVPAVQNVPVAREAGYYSTWTHMFPSVEGRHWFINAGDLRDSRYYGFGLFDPYPTVWYFSSGDTGGYGTSDFTYPNPINPDPNWNAYHDLTTSDLRVVPGPDGKMRFMAYHEFDSGFWNGSAEYWHHAAVVVCGTIGPCMIPPLRQRQRDDGLANGGPRARNANGPRSMQFSGRRGWENTYL